ncbi:hypothetical protein DKX38_002094 [Salix brachista]|uniref:40S ribosomal protein S15 n=2 Tax=Salix TaxID=40685 RepID=A0A5N5NP13_9ROSI|nr:hypothetical protein DKX38_002094 [Salix brachista]
MADVETDVTAAGQPKKRTFKKFSFRGVDLDALLDMSTDELVKLFPARARRRFQRGLKRKPMALIKKLRKAVRFFNPCSLPFWLNLIPAFKHYSVDIVLRDYCMIENEGKERLSVEQRTHTLVYLVSQQSVVVLYTSIYLGHYFMLHGRMMSAQKREAPPGEKPEPVRTHLRNMIIVPEMIGSVIGVYNGKTFNQVEIKPEMISHYLAEFSISYKPVKHGRPGIGATHSSRFIPLK